MNTTTKNVPKSKISAKTTVDTQAEISRGALVSMGVAGAIIGLWSLASLISGIVVAGGPVSFVKEWFGAIAGL